MALTSLVAANAAAAAAGAGKKAAQVQLQAELMTDDDWDKFVLRDGLLVVDVYSEWCGPCIGMVGNLKKIKVELGGDNLHLAIARSDTIETLKRFRSRSEPTWMFIANGQLITVVFGADAPRLARTIEQELKNQELVKKGELVREQRAPVDLTPEEQEVATAQEKIIQGRREREEAAAIAARLARRESRAKRIEAHFADVCPAIMMPHAQKHLRKVSDALEPLGVVVADKCPALLGAVCSRLLAIEDPTLKEPAVFAALSERPSLSLLLKKTPDREGDVIELVRRALYGEGLSDEEKPKKAVAEELVADGIPGLFVPADRHQRAAALDLLYPKMVGSVLEPPAAAEPPHVAMLFGAWQRRAVLAAAALPRVQPRVLRHGFFADNSVREPRLLCKTLDQYEERPEKDYGEALVLMVAVSLAEPALAEPDEVPPAGPPAELLALGPLHISDDSVVGAQECQVFFPPGYSAPEPRPKPKSKKKKKRRHDTKDDTTDSAAEQAQSTEAAEVEANGDQEGGGEAGEGEGEAEGEAEGEGDDEEGDDSQAVDKATSPPPQTPH